MPVAKQVVQPADLTPVDPVWVLLDGANGFDAANIRKGMLAKDLAKVMQVLNQYIAQDPEGYQYTDSTFSPFVMDQFNRDIADGADGADGQVLTLGLGQLRRFKKDTDVVQSTNPVISLLSVRIAQREGRDWAVFDGLMYYEGDDNPTLAQAGMHPFRPVVFFPLDPKTCPVAAMLQVALDAIKENDQRKFADVAPLLLMHGIFKWSKKGRPIKGLGFHVTYTTLNKNKLYMVMAKHLNTDSAASTMMQGLIDFFVKGYITTEQMAALNNEGNMIAAALEEKPQLCKRPRRTKASRRSRRNRVQSDDEAEEEGTDEDVSEVLPPFLTFRDAEKGYPKWEDVLQNLLAEMPAGPANTDDAKTTCTVLRQDPFMHFISKMSPEDRSKASDEAKTQLLAMLRAVVSEFKNFSRYATKSTNEVVWKPNAVVAFSDKDKDRVQLLSGVLTFMIGENPNNGILFSRLLCADYKTLIPDVVFELLDEDAFQNQIFASVLNIFDDQCRDNFNELGDLTSLVLSVVHEFVTVFTTQATTAWEFSLNKEGFRLGQAPTIPAFRMLASMVHEPTNQEAAANCANVSKVLKKAAHRISHKCYLFQAAAETFVIGAVLDIDQLVVYTEQAVFPKVQPVFAHQSVDLDAYDMKFAYDQDDPCLKLLRATHHLVDACSSEVQSAELALMSGWFPEAMLSLLRNLMRSSDGFINELFEFGDGAEELFHVIEKRLFPGTAFAKGNAFELLTKLLTAIGDTKYLVAKLPWIKIASLRALVLASIMPVFRVTTSREDDSVDLDDPRVETTKIAACILRGTTLLRHPRFLHTTPGLAGIPEESTHALSAHVKHVVFAGLQG